MEKFNKEEGLIIEQDDDVSYSCFPGPGCKSEAEANWAILRITTVRPNGAGTYPVKTYYHYAEGDPDFKFQASKYLSYNYSWPK